MNFLFWNARRNPGFVRWSKPFWIWGAWRLSDHLYGGIMSNVAHILGRDSTPAQRDRLGRQTMANFYDFVADVGHAVGCTREQLIARIESVEGEAGYRQARAAGKGVIIVTAHMGSFEVGTAALLREEKKIHVLFQTDERGMFERIRSTLRKRLGVIEVPLGEGWTVWMRLRDALQNNEAVLIQGDRVIPGQRGQPVPFFDGTMLMPTGPARLALVSGSPIIPIFSVRTPAGRIKLFIEDAIHVGEEADTPDEALSKLAALTERYIRRFPDQWLANRPAWIEDQGRPTPRPPMLVKIERLRAVLKSVTRSPV